MPIYRVTDEQLMYGQQIQNVLNFTHASSDPATMSELAIRFESFWVNPVRTLQSAAITHTRIRVRMMGSQFAPFERVINLPGQNSGSSEYKLYQSHIIRLRSPIIGRQGRGRVYIAGMAFNLTDNGLLKASIITAWNTQLTTILNAWGVGQSSGYRLVIAPKTATDDGIEVTALSMAPTEGTQRRRNVGRGI